MFQSYFLAWYQKLWISALPWPSHRAEQCGLKMIPRCTIYISILHKYHDIFRLNTSISMFRRWSRMISVPTHNINTDCLNLRPGKDNIYAKSQYIWYILTLFWPFESPNVMRMNHRSAPSILYLKQPSAVWRLRNNFIQIHVAVTLNVINAVCWVSVGNRPHVSTCLFGCLLFEVVLNLVVVRRLHSNICQSGTELLHLHLHLQTEMNPQLRWPDYFQIRHRVNRKLGRDDVGAGCTPGHDCCVTLQRWSDVRVQSDQM